MASDMALTRRWLGILCLLVALGMLIAGETVLKDRFPPNWFLLYWLGCFVFTMLAIILALREARTLQQQARKEQRGLLDSTLKDVEHDARVKQSGNDRQKGRPGESSGLKAEQGIQKDPG